MTKFGRAQLQPRLSANQHGFVAMITCLLLSIIITIITVSFVRIMQREQRQALDRQLSTQAFYAAESGVNYALKKDIASRANCKEPSDPAGFGNIGPSINFTCLLVNETPEELVFDNVNTDQPTVFAITQPMEKIEFFWEGPTGNEDWRRPSDFPIFEQASNWVASGRPLIGVVEVVLYPIKDSVDIDDLRSSSRTYYLYPTTGGGIVDYSVDGEVVRGQCNNGGGQPKDCSVAITGLSAAGSTNGYILRLRSIYNPVSVLINGRNAANDKVQLTGAQRVIDVTGKAGDVLRRIQIRLPIRSGYALPIFAIEAGENLCKLQDTYPGGGTDSCP